MIKLCGMMRPEDIDCINEVKPDYIGMILTDGFRRTVSRATAFKLIERLDDNIKRVGVFVDEPADIVLEYAKALELDVIQLHGNESPDYIKSVKGCGCEIWKAVRVRTSDDITSACHSGADRLMLDSYVNGMVGGTGKTSDWSIIENTDITLPFFLAGGINADNLRDALKVSRDVDLSGGIETNGFKDAEKIREVMKIYIENGGNNG